MARLIHSFNASTKIRGANTGAVTGRTKKFMAAGIVIKVRSIAYRYKAQLLRRNMNGGVINLISPEWSRKSLLQHASSTPPGAGEAMNYTRKNANGPPREMDEK